MQKLGGIWDEMGNRSKEIRPTKNSASYKCYHSVRARVWTCVCPPLWPYVSQHYPTDNNSFLLRVFCSPTLSYVTYQRRRRYRLDQKHAAACSHCAPQSYTVQAASHAESQITPFLARILAPSPRTIPTSRLAFYHPPAQSQQNTHTYQLPEPITQTFLGWDINAASVS